MHRPRTLEEVAGSVAEYLEIDKERGLPAFSELVSKACEDMLECNTALELTYVELEWSEKLSNCDPRHPRNAMERFQKNKGLFTGYWWCRDDIMGGWDMFHSKYTDCFHIIGPEKFKVIESISTPFLYKPGYTGICDGYSFGRDEDFRVTSDIWSEDGPEWWMVHERLQDADCYQYHWATSDSWECFTGGDIFFKTERAAHDCLRQYREQCVPTLAQKLADAGGKMGRRNSGFKEMYITETTSGKTFTGPYHVRCKPEAKP